MTFPPTESPATTTRPLATRWIAVCLLSLIAACDLMTSESSGFTIRVDELSAPASVGPDQTLTVRFSGTIGPDGCSRLERVERRASRNELEITFRGARRTGTCVQMPVRLEHQEIVQPPLEDSFTVRVIQPGGPALVHVVRIR